MNASTGATLLLVEDQPTDADMVERMLVEHRSDFAAREHEHGGKIASIKHADCLADGIDQVRADDIDIVLLDLGLPDSSGLETVSTMLEYTTTIPVVVLTGQKGVGVDAIQRGAQDYLIKGRISADVLVRTITYAIERARIIRDLHDRNHRLELVNEILRTDLRNDVSMIIGWGDQLRDRVAHDDQAAVDAMLEASHHALELTDTAAELIDILSAEHGIDRQACDLRAILTTELDRYRRKADVDLTVNWQVTESEPASVFGTPLLGSVFEHLLTNATTHTDRDGSTITVTVAEATDRISVSIADDGFGMSTTQQTYLTDSSETIEMRAGVGAGLYFVKTVIESIDGELSVADNRPRGTVITLTLERVGGTEPSDPVSKE